MKKYNSVYLKESGTKESAELIDRIMVEFGKVFRNSMVQVKLYKDESERWG